MNHFLKVTEGQKGLRPSAGANSSNNRIYSFGKREAVKISCRFFQRAKFTFKGDVKVRSPYSVTSVFDSSRRRPISEPSASAGVGEKHPA